MKIYEVFEFNVNAYGRTGAPYSRAWQADWEAFKLAAETVHLENLRATPNGWYEARYSPADPEVWVVETEVHP